MKVLALIMALVAFGFVGCASDGDVGQVAQNTIISSAAYKLCLDNPGVVPAMSAVCSAPDDALATELMALYAKYDEAIDDPFLRMQAKILLDAFAAQYGVNLSDMDVDLSGLAGEELRPFVDSVCIGVDAAKGVN